jgi:hypothetical protein
MGGGVTLDIASTALNRVSLFKSLIGKAKIRRLKVCTAQKNAPYFLFL